MKKNACKGYILYILIRVCGCLKNSRTNVCENLYKITCVIKGGREMPPFNGDSG